MTIDINVGKTMYPYPILFGLNLYDIALTLAILIALLLCDKMMEKRKFSVALQKLVLVGFLICILFGFFSAFLFQGFYDFLASKEFKLDSTTGITFFGGLLGGAFAFLTVWFVGGKLFLKDDAKGEEKSKFTDMLDIAACCIPLAHGIGRLGCLAAGCCHGKETDAWYGIEMHTEKGLMTVVPLQLYEAIFLFLLAVLLFWLFYKKEKSFPLMPIYTFFYGLWRFTIEYFRADDRGASFIPFLSPSQLTAICLIIFAIVYYWTWIRSAKNAKT